MVRSVCSVVLLCGALTLFSSCDFSSSGPIIVDPPPAETDFLWDQDNWDEKEWQ